MSEGLFPYPGRVVRVFGFVQAAESALARGLFGNVVGPVKEFTDWVWSDKASLDRPDAWTCFSTAERNHNTNAMSSAAVTFVAQELNGSP